MTGFCNYYVSHLLKMLLYFTHNYTTSNCVQVDQFTYTLDG